MAKVEAGLDVGRVLRFSDVEKGLKELNADISFDVPVRRPSDWTYMVSDLDPSAQAQRKKRSAVYHGERYICAIDRGDIPEIKVYGVEDGWIGIDMDKIHQFDDSKVAYIEVLPTSKYYNIALTKAENHDDNYTITSEGKVFMYQAMRWGNIRGAVQKLGWRHTFEALLRKKVPGVTRESLGRKFNVDMLRYPVGSPEEIHEALFAE